MSASLTREQIEEQRRDLKDYYKCWVDCGTEEAEARLLAQADILCDLALSALTPPAAPVEPVAYISQSNLDWLKGAHHESFHQACVYGVPAGDSNIALVPAAALAEAQRESQTIQYAFEQRGIELNDVRDAAARDLAALRQVLAGVRELAQETLDADRDVKVGKVITALAYTNNMGYDNRADALHAALAKPEGGAK